MKEARLDVVVTLIVVGCIRCVALLPRTGLLVALAFCSDGGDGRGRVERRIASTILAQRWDRTQAVRALRSHLTAREAQEASPMGTWKFGT